MKQCDMVKQSFEGKSIKSDHVEPILKSFNAELRHVENKFDAWVFDPHYATRNCDAVTAMANLATAMESSQQAEANDVRITLRNSHQRIGSDFAVVGASTGSAFAVSMKAKVH